MPGQRAEAVIKSLPEQPRADSFASAAWRAFIMKQAVEDAIARLEGRGG